MPWARARVTPNRKSIGPSKASLEPRLRDAARERPQVRDAMFKVTQPTDRQAVQGTAGADVETDTTPPSSVPLIAKPKLVDNVLGRSTASGYSRTNRIDGHGAPTVKGVLCPGQVFVVEQHSIHPGAGPGLHFSAPCQTSMRSTTVAGAPLPRLHPNGPPNVTPGLDAALKPKEMDRPPPQQTSFYVGRSPDIQLSWEQFADELSHLGFVSRSPPSPSVGHRCGSAST